ncbi:MAG: diaminopimelate dehydrogenase [Christensenellales bacterium]
MQKIRIGILGYGNLGKGVELAVKNNSDMELVGIFTRRDNVDTATGKAIGIDHIQEYKDKIDVLILCGGSATDLPEQSVEMIKYFNTVDSFDTHARIPEHFAKMDATGKESGKLGIISVGWDPGLFSVARMLFGALLPDGNDYTFWGKGVSQGHSDAIRRIEGVVDARQYTVPVQSALQAVRDGENPQLTTRQKHTRECYVVAKEGADKEKIREQIVNMPNYFADYDTTVHFIDMDEMQRNHKELPHGGVVLRSGDTYSDKKHVLELSIKLDSNPEFTGSVLTAYARAIYKMSKEGKKGCVTVFDVPIGLLSAQQPEELRAHLL